jgi:hypothetical protein
VTSKLLSRDERMKQRLLRGPSLDRVEVQTSENEVGKRFPNGHLCNSWSDRNETSTPFPLRLHSVETPSEKEEKQVDEPLSISDCFAPFLSGAYVLIISGRDVVLKYCLLGCSWTLCSLEY